MFRTTKIFSQNLEAFAAGYKIIVNQGGTSSSKTFSIMQLLIYLCMTTTMGIVSCVSESMPHLRRGIIRDAINILGEYYDDNAFNKSEHIYKFSQSELEFFSADQSTKLRGGRRRHLYLNEVNNIARDAFNELDVRTSGTTFLDFNPTADFWVHELLQQNGINDFSKSCFPDEHRNICFIHSTYHDARKFLPLSTIEKIESRRERDPNWWLVYGEGLVGSVEGLIHSKFNIIAESDWPSRGYQVFGLDFGFSGDPAALVWVKITKDGIYASELLYDYGLTNLDLSKKMEQFGIQKHCDEIIADSAEPKSIEELYRMGWNIKPAIKGPDSIKAGIQRINQYTQYWTKCSLNGIKEMRNYMWAKDKNGHVLDSPAQNGYDQLMDARRYAVATVLGKPKGFAGNIKW